LAEGVKLTERRRRFVELQRAIRPRRGRTLQIDLLLPLLHLLLLLSLCKRPREHLLQAV
jgi:hypothetical protein